MELLRDIKVGKIDILILSVILFILFNPNYVHTQENLIGQNTSIKILDKISSKNELVKLTNGIELIYKDLAVKSMKCSNSEFDENPEIKAYLQVRDLTKKNNDKVYVFNNWMFSSSPSITPFDHPVYDIWLIGCN